MLDRVVRFLALIPALALTMLISDGVSCQGMTWKSHSATSPRGLGGTAMAYDAARRQVVLFGGLSTRGVTADTWVWDGVSWTKAKPATSPGARYGHAMAYDAARGQVLLFGGRPSSGNSFADTWTWNGKTWTQVTPTASPTARYGHAMAYDAARKQVVLYGGRARWGNQNDLWTWDGKTWTLAKPRLSPSRRVGHAMAYDAARGQVVLFSGDGLADTWTWNGSTWTLVKPTISPPGLSGHAMVYDTIRQKVVLYGGWSSTRIQNATWTWDGKTWALAKPSVSPPALSGHVMAYDAARQRVVLFVTGGFADTWVWNGRTWVLAWSGLSFPRSGSMTYDAARGQVLLFGNGATWSWKGKSWVQLRPTSSPPYLTGYAMAYDVARGQVVLFGGAGGRPYRYSDDTWIYEQPLFQGSFAPFGKGCGPTPGLALAASAASKPKVGANFVLQTSNAPRGSTVGVMTLGASNKMLGPFALPLSLAPFGMPGCSLYHSYDLLWLYSLRGGTGQFALAIPAIPTLVGAKLHLQAMVPAPKANPAGLLSSNAGTMLIGNK